MIEEIKEKLLENKTLVAVLGTILVMLIGFFAWSNVTKTTVDAQSDLPALSTTFSASSSASDLKTERSSSQTETQKVFVDIKGAVKNEGVYELSSGSRVTDVVKLAGGFTEDADKKSVNLAEKVTDEAVIYVQELVKMLLLQRLIHKQMAALNRKKVQIKSILIPQLWRNSRRFLALAPNVPKTLLTTVMPMVVFHQLMTWRMCLVSEKKH